MVTLSIFKRAVNFLVNFFGLLSWWGPKPAMFVLKWNSIFVFNHQTFVMIHQNLFWIHSKRIALFLAPSWQQAKKLTKKLTAPLKMESVIIIFSMFRLVFVEILSYGVRYALIIAKVRVVNGWIFVAYGSYRWSWMPSGILTSIPSSSLEMQTWHPGLDVSVNP